MTEKDLELAKISYLISNQELYKKNRELILLYGEYIYKISELFDFIMENKSDLFYAYIFQTLIDIGVFCYGYTPEKNFIELDLKLGLSVINGNYTCRNLASFYEDIFKHFYTYPLKMCCYDKKLGNAELELTKSNGNHAINLVKHNDIVYGFDFLNHWVFKVKDENYFEGINTNHTIEYRPNGDLTLGLVSLLRYNVNFTRDRKNKLNLFCYAKDKEKISLEELNKISEDAYQYLNKNIKMFFDFWKKNSDLTWEIKKKMLSLK